jgi:hypothetical protein
MGQRSSSPGSGGGLFGAAQRQLLYRQARQRLRLAFGTPCNRKICATTAAHLRCAQARAAGWTTLREFWGCHQFSR